RIIRLENQLEKCLVKKVLGVRHAKKKAILP
ncbi:MAG: hypothetical protein ACI81T_003353, partial [Bacteroidia bacterium]